PARAASSCAASPEGLAEQPLASATPEEHVLAGRMGVAVAGGNRDALDPEPHRRIEELSHLVRVSAVEQRAVDGDAKAPGARELDGRDRFVGHPFLTHGLVVALAVAVQVD